MPDEQPMPSISVIVPVFNEAANLRTTIASLLAQELAPGDRLELLIVDGRSTDDSAAIAKEAAHADPRVRPLLNPQRTTPHALNHGLREARGEYVGIFGAHCRYAPDYIAVCLRELRARGAVGCSGRVITRPASRSPGALLASWAFTHPFGVSRGSFRTQREGFVDTIPYPVFRRSALVALGGYDDVLVRNQDNDMNFRLRRAGHRLYLTWETWCEYRGRRNLAELFAYARANGWWCGATARRRPQALSPRHYVPFAFVLASVLGLAALGAVAVGALGAPWTAVALAPLVGHLVVGHGVALQVALRERSALALMLPWVFLGFHGIYGFAFGAGLLRGAPARARSRSARSVLLP